MKQNKILKSKRGVAIETAVLFIIIILSLCALITTFPLMQHYQTKIDIILLKQDIELEQITDHFLAFIKNGEELSDDNFKNYVASFDDADNKLSEKYGYYVYGYSLVVKRENNVLLCVSAELHDGVAKIVASSSSVDQDELDKEKDLYDYSKGFAEASFDISKLTSKYVYWDDPSKTLIIYGDYVDENNNTVLRYVVFGAESKIITWLYSAPPQSE